MAELIWQTSGGVVSPATGTVGIFTLIVGILE